MPKGGARPGAGNPGYGKQQAVKDGVEKLTPRWFSMIEEMLDSKVEDNLSPVVTDLIKQLFSKDSYSAKELIKYLARGAADDKRFALDQLGKLMGKLMPVQLTGKDGKDLFPTPLLSGVDVHNNNSNKENSQPQPEDSSSAGGNLSEQDNLDTLIPD